MEQNEKAKRIAELYARGKELSGVLEANYKMGKVEAQGPLGLLSDVRIFGETWAKIRVALQEELDAVSAELAELTK